MAGGGGVACPSSSHNLKALIKAEPGKDSMEGTHEELNKLKPYGKPCRKPVMLTFRYDEVSLHLLTLHFAGIGLRSPWIEAQYGARFSLWVWGRRLPLSLCQSSAPFRAPSLEATSGSDLWDVCWNVGK